MTELGTEYKQKLTRIGTEYVEYRLHKTKNILSTCKHFGQEEHQTNASSKLWAQRATYHIWSHIVKVSTEMREAMSEKQHVEHVFALLGYSRLHHPV